MVPGAPRAATTSGTSKCSTMASESVGRGVPHACMHALKRFLNESLPESLFYGGRVVLCKVEYLDPVDLVQLNLVPFSMTPPAVQVQIRSRLTRAGEFDDGMLPLLYPSSGTKF